MRPGELVSVLWAPVALGTALALMGTWAGWLMGRYRAFMPVRCVAWWLLTVVRPLVMCRSWSARAAFIFLNNIAILAMLMVLGAWPAAAIAGAAVLGISLGIALRVIGEATWDFSPPTAANHNGRRRRVFQVGIWLNALEPPAIALALGLSIARDTAPLPSAAAWLVFAWWVVPPMLIAAAGEALWIGAGLEPRNQGLSTTS